MAPRPGVRWEGPLSSTVTTAGEQVKGDARGLPPTKVKWLGSRVATPSPPAHSNASTVALEEVLAASRILISAVMAPNVSAGPSLGVSVATGFGDSVEMGFVESTCISAPFFLGLGGGMGLGVATLGLKVVVT